MKKIQYYSSAPKSERPSGFRQSIMVWLSNSSDFRQKLSSESRTKMRTNGTKPSVFRTFGQKWNKMSKIWTNLFGFELLLVQSCSIRKPNILVRILYILSHLSYFEQPNVQKPNDFSQIFKARTSEIQTCWKPNQQTSQFRRSTVSFIKYKLFHF